MRVRANRGISYVRAMRRLVLVALLASGCTEHGQTPDGGANPVFDGKAGPDGSGFVCADDSSFEPNDSIQTAFQLPSTPTITFAGLALCPATDVDFYGIGVGSTATLEVVVVSEPNIPPGVAILNAAGTVIANGSADNVGTRATAPNVPAGSYFARVTAPGGGVQENYRMTVNVTP
jgi:hypothetical protein